MTFGKNIQKNLEYRFHVSVFMLVWFFINFSSFKLDTENNANFDAVSSKRATFDEWLQRAAGKAEIVQNSWWRLCLEHFS